VRYVAEEKTVCKSMRFTRPSPAKGHSQPTLRAMELARWKRIKNLTRA